MGIDSCVYALVDATGQYRYVGATRCPEIRPRQHKRLYPDLDFVILEENPEDLEFAEICWIVDLRRAGATLFNEINGGGLMHFGRTKSKEARTRMSAAWTPERRARQSAAMKSLHEAGAVTPYGRKS